MNKTQIWEALSKTDPKHTKGFKRPGGFTGTALKPIWVIQRMTEEFGPAGVGWGMGEPRFQTVEVEETREILVYCWVNVWHSDNRTSEVWGTGGDKVVSRLKDKEQKFYWQTNDEAFKSAYTDAMLNAMKQIGVGADIHMGLFEDQKYLREVTEEFRPEVKRFQEQAKASLGTIQPGVDFDPAEFDETQGQPPIEAYEEPRQKAVQAAQRAPVKREGGMISEGQVRRLWVIAKQAGKDKGEVMAIVGENGFDTVESIHWKKYNEIIEAIQAPF